MTELEASGVGEPPPPYMIFVVVFLFFLTGLLGFLVCHLLKKKGYRCRTGDMDDEEDGEDEKLGVNADEDEEHQDTVEQILKCIIENEANMEAFNEMFGNHNVCVRHDPRLRKESIGGIPPHHHTVHSGTDHNSCHLCAQVRSKKGRRQSRTPRSKQRPGEQTVFSVGRFRVTHHDKKLHGGPNPLVSSGDQLDQSQDSEDRKEGGYNLRSMFKDVRSPSESSGGVAPNVGKRRRSLTIFGLRRGSDPTGVKAGEGTGRETGGVRFAIQQQPVVLEELLQAENIKIAPEPGTKPGIKPEAKPSKNQAPSSPQREAQTSVSSQIQAPESIPAPEGGSAQGPGTEPRTGFVIKPSAGSAAASAPSSLPIPSAASSGQAFKTAKKGGGDTEDMVLKEAYDPGPLQTSTPISPTHRSIPGFTPVLPAGQPEPSSSKECPVTQTPDLEPGSDASLALISLGSSPPSSFQIKTPSSVSSTPVSPLLVTSSPKTAISPAPTPSPKLQSGRAISNQSPVPSGSPLEAQTPSPALTAGSKFNTSPVSPQTLSSSPAEQNLSIGSSPRLTLKSESVTSVTSQRGKVSSPISINEQELEGTIVKPEEKTEMKNVGILKTAKLSPAEGDYKASALSSPTQLSEDRPGILPLSPLSPSSSLGSRVNNVTIIKASPDSRREFSVVAMVEDEEPSTSISDQKRETSEFGGGTEKEESAPAVGHEGKVSLSGVEQFGETPGTEERPTATQEKDDMVQMEDIRDCKVTQSEEAKGADE